MSGLHCYTYVWIENLYLDLVSFIIPTSGFFKFDFRHLYLLLVCNVIPTSVMATSAFAKLDLRHVIPTSGIGKTDIIPSSVISTYGAPHISSNLITCGDSYAGQGAMFVISSFPDKVIF